MVRILVIEDHAELAFGLVINLEQEGYVAVTAESGMAGTTQALTGEFDLILLDLMLPDVSGFDVLRSIRRARLTCPIIVISAKAGEVDRVTAFRLGADDYVTKPFGVLELLERIKARLRDKPRYPRLTDNHVATEICVDASRYEVQYQGP